MKNKLLFTSLCTIVGLYGILILFLIIIFEICGLPLSYLLIFSVVFLLLQFLIAPFITDLTMKWFYHVDFNKEIPEYLKSFINEVCQNNKMKFPKIGFINDGAPNAFTYGRTKNDARMILTRGIFDLLTEEEVKSVVGHELGHAVHYDMFLMTAVQIVPLILYYIYDITFNSDSSDDDDSSLGIVGIIAYILYIISEYVILWFSRTREYYADEFSLRATKNPNSLANALVKIGFGLTTSKHDLEENENNENNEELEKKKKKKKHSLNSISALGIFDAKSSKSLVITSYDNGEINKEHIKKAARWELLNPWAKWYEFNSTHPLISKRIKAISKYSKEYNQEEYINFDETKTESYADDFMLEVMIKFLPYFILIIATILGIYLLDKEISYQLFVGVFLTILAISTILPFTRSHKNKDYKKATVSELLGEIKVSGVTAIPCIVKGTIIGRGNPGYIFSEDFTLQDETGIIFLDYSQPLAIINTLFALLKSKEYHNKEVEIKGWYKRAPIPYIEIYEITLDGKTKRCHTYGFTKFLILLMIMIGIFLIITAK